MGRRKKGERRERVWTVGSGGGGGQEDGAEAERRKRRGGSGTAAAERRQLDAPIQSVGGRIRVIRKKMTRMHADSIGESSTRGRGWGGGLERRGAIGKRQVGETMQRRWGVGEVGVGERGRRGGGVQ